MLREKWALVTGCRQGIGQSVAITLAEYGADLILNDLTISDEDEVTVAVHGLGRKALCISADIASPESVDAMFAQIKEKAGRLDILVNNAGITMDAMAHKMTIDHGQSVGGKSDRDFFVLSGGSQTDDRK